MEQSVDHLNSEKAKILTKLATSLQTIASELAPTTTEKKVNDRVNLGMLVIN